MYMNLRDFIKQALMDIVGAVQDTQKEITDGEIVPAIKNTYKSIETNISPLQVVEFDVSVSADTQSDRKATLSVVAAVIGGNVGGQRNTSSGHVANLRFKIPIMLPQKAHIS
jgi:hypothetical protein